MMSKKTESDTEHKYRQGGNVVTTKKPIDPLLFAAFDVYPEDWSAKDISDWRNPCVS